VRSILDGHIVLSRKQASANQYPAIDVLASVSRVMSAVASPEHAQAAGRLRALLAKYQELELLIQIGEYRRGADALADQAVQRRAAVQQFLAQKPGERQGFEQTLAALRRLGEGV